MPCSIEGRRAPASPQPMASSDTTRHIRKDMGLVSQVFHEEDLLLPPGLRRHRPHPLLHHRLQPPRKRPAVRRRRARTARSPSATTATSSTPTCCAPSSRPRAATFADRHRLRGHRPDGRHRARPRLERAHGLRHAARPRRLLPRHPHPGRRHRGARPDGQPAACRLARSTAASALPPRPAPSTTSARSSSARSSRARRSSSTPRACRASRPADEDRQAFCVFEYIYFARPDS